MNYNLRVSMERINGNVVTQLEVSSIGRARRRMITSPDFDAAMADLKLGHDALLEEIAAYNRPAPAPEQILVDGEVLDLIPHPLLAIAMPVPAPSAASVKVRAKPGPKPKLKAAAPAHT